MRFLNTDVTDADAVVVDNTTRKVLSVFKQSSPQDDTLKRAGAFAAQRADADAMRPSEVRAHKLWLRDRDRPTVRRW